MSCGACTHCKIIFHRHKTGVHHVVVICSVQTINTTHLIVASHTSQHNTNKTGISTTRAMLRSKAKQGYTLCWLQQACTHLIRAQDIFRINQEYPIHCTPDKLSLLCRIATRHSTCQDRQYHTTMTTISCTLSLASIWPLHDLMTNGHHMLCFDACCRAHSSCRHCGV